MSHADALCGMAADHLRSMANGPHLGLSHYAVGALIAGVAALDTLDRVRDALTEIDRLENDAWAAWKRDGDMFEQGRSHAYHHAHTIITEALGDTP